MALLGRDAEVQPCTSIALWEGEEQHVVRAGSQVDARIQHVETLDEHASCEVRGRIHVQLDARLRTDR
jgi:hypothetical protein